MSLTPGTAVGPYEISAPIGAGAIGEVYRAHDVRLDREVAIKLLQECCAADPDLVQRFEQEARATAALSHPAILTIHDVGRHGEIPYLVTELLSGESLRQRLGRGPLPPGEAVELALQLVSGLAAAHALRIVHRDIKPENLFLTRDGRLKILDFGLAKLRESALEGSPDGTTLNATEPGRVLGTVGYMAPEQVRGEPVDERADLFAAGAVLHEMISGRAPFSRSSSGETMAAILRDDPPDLSDSIAGVPEGLQRLIRHCLGKDPGERFQSARDLLFALETLSGETGGAGDRPQTAAVRKESASIAVLPFADMSPARDQDFFCEGLAEELINSLSRIEGLRVAARSSSFQFRTQGVDIRAVGQRLGVASVLEGSVRKAGDRLRVTVQLIDAADGYHRWSERYDRKLEDVFAIQDEIAEKAVAALRGVLTARDRQVLQRRRLETDLTAFEYYLRGRQAVNELRRPALEVAKQMFERALEIDGRYAPAWAGLADVHTWLHQWWGGNEQDLQAAERASRRALELSPDSAEARASRAFAMSLEGRYQEAEEEFEKALRLDPTYFEAHYFYARTCFAHGKLERSAELFRRAGELRREDYQSLILLEQVLRMLGRQSEANAAIGEGVRRVEARLDLDATDGRALSLGAHGLYSVGERERAMSWMDKAVDLYPDEAGVLVNAGCLYAKAGEKEKALGALEKAFSRGQGKRDWVEHDPDYDSLRDEPRFQALLKKLS